MFVYLLHNSPCTSQARKVVPRIMLFSVSFLFVLALCLVTSVSSQGGGPHSIRHHEMILRGGFVNTLHMTPHQASALSLPGLFASAYIFVYVFSKQLKAMADSNIWPVVLQKTYGPYQTPYVAVLVGCFLVLMFAFFARYSIDEHCMIVFGGISLLGTSFIYVMISCSYHVFKLRYSALPNDYCNPFGRLAAYLGGMIFALMMVAIVTYYPDATEIVFSFVIYLVACSLYYYFYARHHQCFSKEEQSKLFVAYVINSNRKSRSKLRSSFSANSRDISTSSMAKEADVLNLLELSPPSTASGRGSIIRGNVLKKEYSATNKLMKMNSLFQAISFRSFQHSDLLVVSSKSTASNSSRSTMTKSFMASLSFFSSSRSMVSPRHAICDKDDTIVSGTSSSVEVVESVAKYKNGDGETFGKARRGSGHSYHRAHMCALEAVGECSQKSGFGSSRSSSQPQLNTTTDLESNTVTNVTLFEQDQCYQNSLSVHDSRLIDLEHEVIQEDPEFSSRVKPTVASCKTSSSKKILPL